MAANGSVEIPAKCKAAVVVNAGPDFKVEVEEVDVPDIGPTDLLLKINATGLCMSDVHYMIGDLGPPPMAFFKNRSAGHEGAGVVVKVGEHVQGWKVGDRAGIKAIMNSCGQCEQCYQGMDNYCKKATWSGLMAPGSYQQYIAAPARYTTRIPDGVSDHVAGPIMCSATTMYRALLDSGLKAGEFVVFPGGGGGVGIQGVQIAHSMGLRIIVVDSGDAKEKLAKECGAEYFVDFAKEKDVTAKVVEAAGGVGAHGVLVTAYQSYKDAVGYTGTRIGAVVMCVALPGKGQLEISVEPGTFVFRKLRVTGSLVGNMQDAAACLELARRGVLKPICEVRGVSAFPESVAQLKRGEIAGRVVIDFNKD